MTRKTLFAVLGVLLLAGAAGAAEYYIDFGKGSDDRAGTSARAAWKHCPGDAKATGQARAVKLGPGDIVRFKGGVVYRGHISITASGAAGKPIVYDGNASGDWGRGKAIIDGSLPLEGLKRCASAEDAWGNPNFKNIYWTTVPKGAKWNTLNVSQGLRTLAWSQDPNPADPVLQENPKYFYKTKPDIPQTLSSIQVKALKNMSQNWQRPLVAMFDGTRASAVVENLNGGQVEVTLSKPVTVVEFSVTPQPRYVNPKEMSFQVDGKEVLKINLENHPDKAVEQRFKLPAPVTFKTLVVKFISAYPPADGKVRNWGAVRAISGYDAQGRNVLLADRKTVLRNVKVFTQDDPDYYENSLLALYGRPNVVYYKRILSYDPAKHQLHIETLGHGQKPYDKNGAFSIVNSPRFIDTPGEYALILKPEADGSHKLLLWPPDGKPENLTRAQHGRGISVRGSYVTIQGFWIRKQGWKGSTGISARGKGSDLVIRDVKVSNLRGRGAGITTMQIDNVLVENCEVSDNAGHTKGILLRNARNIVVRGCTLRKNSSTALDFYTVANGVVQDCLVVDNTGMHANGLTFYVGCKNILVERNLVRNGNVGLTVQDGDGMIIRNNIIEGGRGGAPAVGLWSGGAYNNIIMTNNVFRYHGKKDSWTAAIYGGNPRAKGYAIVNNVIDGLSGNVFRKADLHHNIFTWYGPALPEARLGNNLYVPDLAAIFVNPDKGDYRLKPGSPAIDAGVAITSINRYDRAGRRRPTGKAVDIGPYEFVPPGAAPKSKPIPADPHTFQFSFDGYKIAEPQEYVAVYKMKFKKRQGAETITLKGIDRSGEGGGKVNLRPTRGGYIFGWDNPGHWLEWTVEAPEAGAYEVCIEHAGETPGTRQVLLNGQPVKGLEAAPFAATGSWTSFEKVGLKKPLMLKAGKNVIRFVNVTGGHNFKTLEFIPVVAE
ncbi:MAG: carbohydrate-binding protein [Anaerolineaceae bacterium]|nr:carbohydrate-binding protein [Anaerolineaceae bacterium]